jgi:hypothetical protein
MLSTGSIGWETLEGLQWVLCIFALSRPDAGKPLATVQTSTPKRTFVASRRNLTRRRTSWNFRPTRLWPEIGEGRLGLSEPSVGVVLATTGVLAANRFNEINHRPELIQADRPQRSYPPTIATKTHQRASMSQRGANGAGRWRTMTDAGSGGRVDSLGSLRILDHQSKFGSAYAVVN